MKQQTTKSSSKPRSSERDVCDARLEKALGALKEPVDVDGFARDYCRALRGKDKPAPDEVKALLKRRSALGGCRIVKALGGRLIVPESCGFEPEEVRIVTKSYDGELGCVSSGDPVKFPVWVSPSQAEGLLVSDTIWYWSGKAGPMVLGLASRSLSATGRVERDPETGALSVAAAGSRILVTDEQAAAAKLKRRDIARVECVFTHPWGLDEASQKAMWTWSHENTATSVRRLRHQSRGAEQELEIASLEHGVPVDFSEEALKEAARLPDVVRAGDRRGRKDLRKIPFVTIDGEDSRDFDDAVWGERLPDGRWHLMVAIADVSHYVRPGSALERDVQERCTSVYFPISVVPMLPEKLSNGLCSLNPDEDRLAMVADMVFSERGDKVEECDFVKAVIRSHARLTYNQVWDAIRDLKGARKVLKGRWQDVESLYELYKLLRKQRTLRHALDFEAPETKAILTEDHQIEGFELREMNDAHHLIEEMMLAANVCAAAFVLEHNRRSLFRVHDHPSPEKLGELVPIARSCGVRLVEDDAASWAELIERTKEDPVLQVQILRSMARAEYTPHNIGHFGLQYGHYAHFTSPIRRYPDLLLHRVIKGILSRRIYRPELAVDASEFAASRHMERLNGNAGRDENAPKLSKKDAEDLAVWETLGMMCSVAERRADDATRDVMNYLKCDWLQKHRRETFEAKVVGIIDAGVFVQIVDSAIDGFVHVSQLGREWFAREGDRLVGEWGSEIQMGDVFNVRAEEIDFDKRRISFKVVGLEQSLDENERRHEEREEAMKVLEVRHAPAKAGSKKDSKKDAGKKGSKKKASPAGESAPKVKTVKGAAKVVAKAAAKEAAGDVVKEVAKEVVVKVGRTAAKVAARMRSASAALFAAPNRPSDAAEADEVPEGFHNTGWDDYDDDVPEAVFDEGHDEPEAGLPLIERGLEIASRRAGGRGRGRKPRIEVRDDGIFIPMDVAEELALAQLELAGYPIRKKSRLGRDPQPRDEGGSRRGASDAFGKSAGKSPKKSSKKSSKKTRGGKPASKSAKSAKASKKSSGKKSAKAAAPKKDRRRRG